MHIAAALLVGEDGLPKGDALLVANERAGAKAHAGRRGLLGSNEIIGPVACASEMVERPVAWSAVSACEEFGAVAHRAVPCFNRRRCAL